jgi:hypothetical protein
MFKPLHNGWIRDFPKLCLMWLIMVAAGCGGSRPRIGQVSGSVQYKNEVLRSGTITWTVAFVSEDGQMVTALVGQDGRYKAENIPTGSAKIAVVGTPQMPPGLRGAKEKPIQPDERDRRLLRALEKFKDHNKSGLMFTLNKGQQEHDIELK